ncbi:MAG: hypothetical protein ABIQ74_13125 [Chitinophagales bacterium]
MRWIILGFALITLILFYSGWIRKKKFTTSDNRASLIYMIACDIQLLAGLALYFFISPVTHGFFQSGSGALEDAGIRFYSLEHPVLMLLGIAAAHIGRIASKKATDDQVKFKRGAIWFTISIILILVRMPW